MVTVEEFMAHHGVKGMKWGIRKDRRSSKGSGSSGPPKPKAHELSDEDLKKAIDRMNMEQQYSRLIAGPTTPKKDNEAAKFIKELGKGLAKDLIKGQLQQLAADSAKKRMVSSVN